MVAAIVFNGKRLYAEQVWVPVVIWGTTAAAVWLFYDAFLRSIRWNVDVLEARDVFSRGWLVKWKDAKSVSWVGGTLNVRDQNDVVRKINLSYRVGARDLIRWLSRSACGRLSR